MIGLIFGVAYWFSTIWIYYDAKTWRRRGVPVTPGFIASLFLVIAAVLEWLSLLAADELQRIIWGGYYYSYFTSLFRGVFMIGALVICFLAYLIWRTVKYQKIAVQGNPPLPAAPAWTKWLFIVILILPLLLAGGLLLLLILAFRHW